MIDYAKARTNMVQCQIQPNGVINPQVLDSFQSVPREMFLPESLRGAAYVDEDIALPGGGHLMEPVVLARMLQVAAPRQEDAVLVVGDHTGYAAAVLSRLSASVDAPRDIYTLIVIAGAVPSIPPQLLVRVAIGGRLVAVVMKPGSPMGSITLIERDGEGAFSTSKLFDAATPFLPEFAPQPTFRFGT